MGGDIVARHSRTYSESGIYHAMARGNEKKDIFKDNEDRIKYLDILRDKKGNTNFYLYAYCIMSNHIHLIIKEEDESLSDIMKRINVSYASYLNKKYHRVGHVFQDRFKSEPIEDDRYLLTAIRYVHNNPVKAKLVESPENFAWSSYKDYIGNSNSKIVDTGFVLSLFSSDAHKSVKLFEDFSREFNRDKFIDIYENDEKTINGYIEAEKYLSKLLETENLKLEDLKKKENRKKRDKIILDLRSNSNLSIRETARLLDIGRNIVANIK